MTTDTTTNAASMSAKRAEKFEGGVRVPTDGFFVGVFNGAELKGLYVADDKELTQVLGTAQRFNSAADATPAAEHVNKNWEIFPTESVRVITLAQARTAIKPK